MAAVGELFQLESDFLSGRNPLAYIPLCHALRRQKKYIQALELCQRGVRSSPNSIAGRTLLARLLGDLGRYEEALREIAKVEVHSPAAMGILVEKAKCLIRLRRLMDADVALQTLNSLNPLDPQVQLLNRGLSELRNHEMHSTPIPLKSGFLRRASMTSKEILDHVRDEMKGHCAIISIAVIPKGAGEPAVEGTESAAEVAYKFYKDATKACKDMDVGEVRLGIVETTDVQLIVLVRQGSLVSLAIQSTPSLGKILYRFQTVVG
ncbi:MAG: CDC27 family protein, partial [Candidatus Sumerlaeota bacterium]